MTSRSGSSMTARIFAAHGLKHKGNNNCEKKEIDKWIKQYYQKDHLNPEPAPYIKGFKAYIESLGIDLWKGDVMYYPLFHRLKPKIVCIKRDVESVVKSLRAKNPGAKSLNADKVRQIILTRYEYMDELKEKHGGVDVFTDQLIKGDYSSLEEAFEYCEIPFKEKIARNEIDPSRWHYKVNY
jgi:hypothetical protein